MTILGIDVCCRHFDWQVSSVAEIFNAPRTLSSAVEFLWPMDRRDSISSEWRNEADPTLWRDLLRSFNNMKKLRVDDGLVRDLSRTQQPEDGESPTVLLPELTALEYPAIGDANDAFTTFSAACQNVGRLFSLIPISARLGGP